jgi:outer membrane murein-binding lipoprotein Lpp
VKVAKNETIKKIKKLLTKPRSGLVLFDEAESDRQSEKRDELLIKPLTKDRSAFNIHLAENRLDVYLSPHLLDLSQTRNTNDDLRYQAEPETDYADLPYGQWLEKYHILDFWDFDRSEILIFCRRVVASINSALLCLSNDPELSPKFLADAELKIRSKTPLEEATLVAMLLFFADNYYKIYLFFYKIFWLTDLAVRNIITKDETIWLPESKPTADPARAAIIDRIIAASSAPTISEIIKPKILNPETTSETTEKFKIIPSPAGRKKEIQEKYLAGNFMRKGVVVSPQPPAAPWPKDSFAWDIGNFAFSTAALKSVAVFVAIVIILASSVKAVSYWQEVKSVKGQVMGEAEAALTNISDAGVGLKSLDFNAAREKFLAANANFASAKNQLDNIKSFLTTLAEIAPAENTYKSGANLIELGDHLSSVAGNLLKGIEAASNSDLSLASRINNLSLELTSASAEVAAAQDNADKIGLSHLSAEQKDQFIKLKNALPAAAAGLIRLKDTADFSVKVLGNNDLRRYLLVFQNDNELRATGGFMGSFALLDFRQGKIEKITLPSGGTYDVRAGFTELVAPPQPLTLITNRWELQDSNWWPDYPTSAKNIKWFYEKSGGPTVDGVIAINSSFLGELLKITGPIDLPNYGKSINSDNFQTELQKSIELKATDKTQPKKILSEMAPLLLDRLLNLPPSQFFDLTKSLGQGLKNKDIQMYFSDQSLEQFAEKNGWAGNFVGLPGSDYLSVISANIGGGKTDPVIRQKIYQRTEIQTDGSVIDKVLIERYNFGPTDEFFTTIANNSYLRVYVPLGSQLIRAIGFKGFSVDKFKPIDPKLEVKAEAANENNAIIDESSGTKIYEENGRTVFANWSVAGPGESRQLLLEYKLPFKVAFSEQPQNIVTMAANILSPQIAAYGLKFQKQSGRNSDEFISEVVYPDNLALKLNYPDSATLSGGQAVWTAKTDSDKFYLLGFVKK